MSASKDKDIQEIANILGKKLGDIIENAKNPSVDAGAPFRKNRDVSERYGKLFSRPMVGVKAKKPLKGFKTGTFIDDLFLDENGKRLGIPIVGQVSLSGLSGCGKSILVQEIALRVANMGKKVILATTEDVFQTDSPRNDLQSRMREKCDILKLDWNMVCSNLFVLDTISRSSLRDWYTFINTLRYLEDVLQGIDLLIIDSTTLLESYRGAIKYRLLELIRWNQTHGVTAIFVSQRASEDDAGKLNVAGGLSVSHNADIVMCVDKRKAVGQLKEDFGVKQWTECHFARVLACRLSGYDARFKKVEITKDGFLRLVKSDQKT